MAEALTCVDSMDVYTRQTNIQETLHATAAFTPKVLARVIMAERLTIAQLYKIVRKYVMAEALHGTTTFVPSRSYTMSEALHAVAAFSPRVRAKVTMAELLSAAAQFVTGRSIVMAEHLTAGVAFAFSRTTNIAESLHATATYTIRSHLIGSINEELKLVDTLTQKLIARMVMAEELCIDDLYVIPGSKSGYSAPTDRFGMSMYDSLLVNEMSMLSGVPVGVGDVGIYSLDGDTDNGAAIPTSITTSEWDQKKPGMKRPGYMYLGLRFRDPGLRSDMTVSVVYNQDGVTRTVRVPAEPHISNGMLTMRFKMPPVRSAYFQYKVTSNGAVWTIDRMESVFELLSRRV
jgi:hypothetical protein